MARTKTSRIEKLESTVMRMGAVVELLAKSMGDKVPKELANVIKVAKAESNRVAYAAKERKRSIEAKALNTAKNKEAKAVPPNVTTI